jgi:hypothetical protein
MLRNVREGVKPEISAVLCAIRCDIMQVVCVC